MYFEHESLIRRDLTVREAVFCRGCPQHLCPHNIFSKYLVTDNTRVAMSLYSRGLILLLLLSILLLPRPEVLHLPTFAFTDLSKKQRMLACSFSKRLNLWTVFFSRKGIWQVYSEEWLIFFNSIIYNLLLFNEHVIFMFFLFSVKC